MLSLDTAYRSFGGEVEASSTPTICRLSDSRRHQLSAIALLNERTRPNAQHLNCLSLCIAPPSGLCRLILQLRRPCAGWTPGRQPVASPRISWHPPLPLAAPAT